MHNIVVNTKDGSVTAWRDPNIERLPSLTPITGTSPWGKWKAWARSCVTRYNYKYPPKVPPPGKHSIRRAVALLLAAEEEEQNVLRAERVRSEGLSR
jgi:hypothetical protein